MDHRRDEGNMRKLPEYSWDYCFPGDELGFKWTVLVGKERSTGSCMASAVPMKGFTTGKFTVDKCLEFVEENGDKERSMDAKRKKYLRLEEAAYKRNRFTVSDDEQILEALQVNAQHRTPADACIPRPTHIRSRSM